MSRTRHKSRECGRPRRSGSSLFRPNDLSGVACSALPTVVDDAVQHDDAEDRESESESESVSESESESECSGSQEAARLGMTVLMTAR